MKHRSAAIPLCICACVFAQVSLAAPITASNDPVSISWFKNTTTALHDAFTTGDRSVWARVLDDDFMMTTEEGLVLDRKEILQDIRPLPAGFSAVQKVRKLSVRNLGDAAVVHFWLDEWETVLGDKLFTTYIETDTYARRESGWRMVAAQVTVQPRNLPPVKITTRGWPSLLGTYGINGSPHWTLKVYESHGSLYAAHTPDTATELIPLSPLAYYEKGTIHILVFVRDDNGAVDRVLELHKYNEVVMKRLSPPASS